MRLPFFATALCLAAMVNTAWADAPRLARNLAATCANCHGTEGRALPGAGMEPLAGMDKARLQHKMGEFKAGTRPATVMHQIAKGYTSEEIALIAAYYAARTPAKEAP